MAFIGTAQISLTDLNDAVIAGTAPSSPINGTLWIDTSVSPSVLKRYNNGSWIAQTLSLELLDPAQYTKIEDSKKTLADMANDNVITESERRNLKDKLTLLTGATLTDTGSLPTMAVIESSSAPLIGEVYQLRSEALNVGVLFNDALYVDISTKYTALATYLNAMNPKPWDLTSSVSNTIVYATWLTTWKNYYDAVVRLRTAIALKIKTNSDSALNDAKKYTDSTTGNLLENTTMTGTVDKWKGSITPAVENKDFFGVTVPTQKITTSADAQVLSEAFTVDPSKAYEVTLWFQSDGAGGSDYFGLNAFDANSAGIGIDRVVSATGALGLAKDTNPYFWNGAGSSHLNNWVKRTAFIMPSGTSDIEMKGLGTNIISNMRMLPNTKKLRIRYLNYYNNGVSKSLWVANPKVVEVSAQTLIDVSAIPNASTVIQNFNNRNDRISAIPASPTLLSDGTAIDHVANIDGSVDLSFEWAFNGSGNEYNIDGFIVYIYNSNLSSTYSFGTSASEEQVYYLPADKRAFLLYGVPSNKYYSFGVSAYRVVDNDIAASGILKSPIAKSTVRDENPYRPSTTVAFAGNITGTIDGTSASSLASKANGSIQKDTLYNGVKMTDAGFIATRSDNKVRAVMNATDGIKIEKSTDGTNFTPVLSLDATTGDLKMSSGSITWGSVNLPTAAQVGARPAGWVPSASEVGARPVTWVPTANDVGARPIDWYPTAEQVGARPSTWTPTANDVGARPVTWTPTAADVKARADTWTPTAAQVGARASTWLPTVTEIGAKPSGWVPAYSDITGTKPDYDADNTWSRLTSDGRVKGLIYDSRTGNLLLNTDYVFSKVINGFEINAGTINGAIIKGGAFISSDQNSTFQVQAGYVMLSTNYGGSVLMSADEITGYGSNGSRTFGMSSKMIYSAALSTSNYNVYLGSKGEARVVDYTDVYIGQDGDVNSYKYKDLRAARFHSMNGLITTPKGYMIVRAESGYYEGYNYIPNLVLLQGSEVRAVEVNAEGRYVDFRAATIYSSGDPVATQRWVGQQGYSTGSYSLPSNLSVNSVNANYITINGSGSTWLRTDAVDSTNSNNHIYLRGNSVKCTAYGSTSSYVNCLALKFDAQSDVKVKANIKELTIGEANEILDNITIYEYYLKGELEDSIYNPTLGTLVQGAPQKIQSTDGNGIDLYSMTSLNTKIAQRHKELIESIQSDNKDIYTVLGVMIDDSTAQEKKINELEHSLLKLESQFAELKAMVLG